MIEDILKELGFTEYEINIYITLVEFGECTPGKVAEKAKIHRRNVYDALDRLVKKGFASSVIKNNRKFYSAVNPNRIKSLFREKINLIDTLIPPLEQKFKESQIEQEVKLLEGKEGIKSFFEEMIGEMKKGVEFFIIGAPAKLPKILPYYLPQALKRSQNSL